MRAVPLGAAEATRNLLSTPLLSGILMSVCLLAGAGVGAATTVEVAQVSHAAHAQYLAGATAVEVVGEGGSPLDATRCHALIGVDGIVSSGGVMAAESVRLGTEPDADVRLLTATPGYPAAAWPELENMGPLSVIAASDLARSGLRSGGTVQISSPYLDVALLHVDAVPDEVSVTGADRLLVVTAPPRGVVANCLVLATPSAAPNVVALLTTYFGDGATMRQVLLPSALVTSPDELLHLRLSQYGWLIGGLLCAIALLGNWFARRDQFALYRLLGSSERLILVMLVVELACACLLPAQLGLVLGIGITAGPLDELVARSLFLDVLRFDAVLLMLPALAVLSLPRSSALSALRGK